MSGIVCKMKVDTVANIKDINGNVSQQTIYLSAVYGPDGTTNGQWSKWTPSASFSIVVTNPAAFDRLGVGKEYIVDICEDD